jgi:hypothetical protein
MKRSTRVLLPLLGGLALSHPTIGRAELPPWVYGQEQRQAPYVLELLVRSVHSTGSAAQQRRLDVRAQVLEVKRQPPGSRLRPGNLITLVYELPPPRPAGWVGPSVLLAVEPGEQLPAWLAPDPSRRGVYAPAAGGRSFGPSFEGVVEPGREG